MRVFSFFDPAKPLGLIDVFVDEPIAYDSLEAERIFIEAGEIKIPVVSIGHLIQLKEISSRPQDLADIRALKEIMKRNEER